MNFYLLIALAIIGGLAGLMSGRAWIHRRSESNSKARAEAPVPRLVSDPAGPDLQARAVARQLALPHFGRIVDSSLVDYYGGIRHDCIYRDGAPHYVCLHGAPGTR